MKKMRVFFQRYGKSIGALIHRMFIYGAVYVSGVLLLTYLVSLPPRDLGIACGGIVAMTLMLVGLAYVAEWTGSSIMTSLLAMRLRREAEAYLKEVSEVHEDENIDTGDGIDTLEAFANATKEQRAQFIPPEPSWYYPSAEHDTLKLPDDLEEP